MMVERKPLFVECKNCGERWKHLTLPIDVEAIPKEGRCPNCGEQEEVYLCPAATEPRDGKEIVDA